MPEVRRRKIAIVAYLLVIAIGIVAIILSFVGPGLWKSAISFGFGLGTVGVGIYAWIRGLGGNISGTTVTFYIRWWDGLVILALYGVGIGIAYIIKAAASVW